MKKKIISSILCGILFISVGLPNVVLAQDSISEIESITNEEVKREIDKFIEIDEDGNRWFNDIAAKEYGVKEHIVNTGIVYNAIVLMNLPDDSDGEWGAKYGNFCGFGNIGNSPIDTLDFFCMLHDQCYADKSKSKVQCDKEFVNNLKANLSRIRAQSGKYAEWYAKKAIWYFS